MAKDKLAVYVLPLGTSWLEIVIAKTLKPAKFNCRLEKTAINYVQERDNVVAFLDIVYGGCHSEQADHML